MVTLKHRINTIQLEIIENYIDGKEKREWSEVARHLRVRRNDLSDDIIKSLHVHSKKRRKELAEYLDKNWDEIFAIFDTKAGGDGTGSATQTSGAVTTSAGAAELTGASIAEIRRMLEEVLANRNLVAPVAAVSAAKKAPAPVAEEAVDDVDELDEVEELAEDVDEIDEVEELAEDVDEVEELAEDIDEADEVEELAEDVDEVEELAEEADEEVLDEVEEIEDAEEEAAEEPVEETVEEEVEDLAEEEPVEEAAEEESAEELADAEESVDELDEVEELDEEVEDLDEAVDELEEPVDELEGEDDDDLEVLESAEDEIDAFIKSMAPPPLDYVPSNETYFTSEKFATVENLFAEELKLGNYTPYRLKGSLPIEITIYPLPVYETEESEEKEVQTEEEIVEVTAEEPVVEEVVEEAPVEDVVEEAAVEEPQTEDEEDFIEDDIIDEPLMGEAQAEEAPVEELTEEVPDYLPEPDFSMTSFGENLSDDVPELQEENVIVEQDDGVFSIAEDLKITDVVQDADFKSLVDSVL
jgi:hypothetical protein